MEVYQDTLTVTSEELNLTRITLPEIPPFESLAPLVQHQLHDKEGVKLAKLKPWVPANPMLRMDHPSGNSYGLIAVGALLVTAIVLAIVGWRKGWWSRLWEAKQRGKLNLCLACCKEREGIKDDVDECCPPTPSPPKKRKMKQVAIVHQNRFLGHGARRSYGCPCELRIPEYGRRCRKQGHHRSHSMIGIPEDIGKINYGADLAAEELERQYKQSPNNPLFSVPASAMARQGPDVAPTAPAPEPTTPDTTGNTELPLIKPM